MKTLARDKANTLWAQWWDEMAEEWFKLEVLQDYSGEDGSPSLQAWLKGDRQKSVELMKKHADLDFLASCQEKIQNGVKLIRVHVVEEPRSPYLEWEIEFYRHINIPKGGESVSLLPKNLVQGLDIPAGDLMIFDNKRVAVNTYDSGRMTHETFYDETDDIDRFLDLKKAILKTARPLS